ncbi:hypothetical protein E3N88_07884 [Mikania micrantha]|uniref:Uncharacterized protein n=1 Tax=Mikania micrantha TaxID=192012 RepID=A0A5N6PEP4_9ASTR|nr:hypothetical protein E3N88_07884 [Mikania micrantha]
MASKASNGCGVVVVKSDVFGALNGGVYVSEEPGVSPDESHRGQALRARQPDERHSFLIRAYRPSGDLRVRLKVFCGLIRSPTFVIQNTCEYCAIIPRIIGVFELLCHVSH